MSFRRFLFRWSISQSRIPSSSWRSRASISGLAIGGFVSHARGKAAQLIAGADKRLIVGSAAGRLALLESPCQRRSEDFVPLAAQRYAVSPAGRQSNTSNATNTKSPCRYTSEVNDE